MHLNFINFILIQEVSHNLTQDHNYYGQGNTLLIINLFLFDFVISNNQTFCLLGILL